MSPLMDDNVLFYDDSKCTGCRYCELACSLRHHNLLNFNFSNITITTNVIFEEREKNSSLFFAAAHCIHCDPAPCQIVCPTGAIHKENNGRVFLNELKCIGCRSCTFVCSLSVAWLDSEAHISHKCDLCNGEPQCVDVCSVEAITFIPRTTARKIMEKRNSEKEF